MREWFRPDHKFGFTPEQIARINKSVEEYLGRTDPVWKYTTTTSTGDTINITEDWSNISNSGCIFYTHAPEVDPYKAPYRWSDGSFHMEPEGGSNA